MAFCNNHETIYFDGLCRTKKAETLLSLIHATYQTKLNSNGETQDAIKSTIAEKLVDAYKLFKFDAGTYSGDVGAFSSQYTIGHEMGIWKNSDLDLTDLARKVALGDITIKEYLDVVFLNYIQPVKGKMVHVLYHLLTYMKKNGLNNVSKEQMSEAYNAIVPESARGESINAIFNFLIGTDFFVKVDRSSLKLSSEYKIDDIINNCNITYLDEQKFNYNDIKSKFDNLSTYLEYLLDESGFEELKKSVFSAENTNEIDDAIIANISFNSEISEEDFRGWLSKQIKKDGNLLSDEYQKAYYYILKAIPSMLGFRDVFSIKDTDEFKKYRTEMENSEKYKESNPNIGVGTLSAALTKYGSYLDERKGFAIPTERLSQILKDWCDRKYVESNITSTLVGFGFKFAESIKNAKISPKQLLIDAGVDSTMEAYISRGKDLYFAIKNESIGIKFVEDKTISCKIKFDTNYSNKFERNRIVFGAPGTGKSHTLNKDVSELVQNDNASFERVTFHPEYSYSSFVGCYKPVSENGRIEYKYVAGPFMRVLVDAYRSGRTNQPKPHILLIEELNRAKVSAVFGEVFQLLDRNAKGSSDYDIAPSEDIKKYLCEQLGGCVADYSKIKIPNNMYIWATMNSADQGVFPMDTAFKRRWNFEYIGINEQDENVKSLIILNDQSYDWNQLRKAINRKLSELKVNEDKLLGPYFVNDKYFNNDPQNLAANKAFIDVIKSKVIMYLFEDACKQKPGEMFAGCDASRYSYIRDAFDKIGINIFGNSFKAEYYDKEA